MSDLSEYEVSDDEVAALLKEREQYAVDDPAGKSQKAKDYLNEPGRKARLDEGRAATADLAEQEQGKRGFNEFNTAAGLDAATLGQGPGIVRLVGNAAESLGITDDAAGAHELANDMEGFRQDEQLHSNPYATFGSEVVGGSVPFAGAGSLAGRAAHGAAPMSAALFRALYGAGAPAAISASGHGADAEGIGTAAATGAGFGLAGEGVASLARPKNPQYQGGSRELTLPPSPMFQAMDPVRVPFPGVVDSFKRAWNSPGIVSGAKSLLEDGFLAHRKLRDLTGNGDFQTGGKGPNVTPFELPPRGYEAPSYSVDPSTVHPGPNPRWGPLEMPPRGYEAPPMAEPFEPVGAGAKGPNVTPFEMPPPAEPMLASPYEPIAGGVGPRVTPFERPSPIPDPVAGPEGMTLANRFEPVGGPSVKAEPFQMPELFQEPAPYSPPGAKAPAPRQPLTLPEGSFGTGGPPLQGKYEPIVNDQFTMPPKPGSQDAPGSTIGTSGGPGPTPGLPFSLEQLKALLQKPQVNPQVTPATPREPMSFEEWVHSERAKGDPDWLADPMRAEGYTEPYKTPANKDRKHRRTKPK